MTQEIEFKDKLEHDIKISVENQTFFWILGLLAIAYLMKRKK